MFSTNSINTGSPGYTVPCQLPSAVRWDLENLVGTSPFPFRAEFRQGGGGGAVTHSPEKLCAGLWSGAVHRVAGHHGLSVL